MGHYPRPRRPMPRKEHSEGRERWAGRRRDRARLQRQETESRQRARLGARQRASWQPHTPPQGRRREWSRGRRGCGEQPRWQGDELAEETRPIGGPCDWREVSESRRPHGAPVCRRRWRMSEYGPLYSQDPGDQQGCPGRGDPESWRDHRQLRRCSPPLVDRE